MSPGAGDPLVPEKYLIGLTGNIATGKSTVAAMLTEWGATVIDADKVAHQVMRAGTPVNAQVVAAFGPSVMGADGEIDRSQLGRIVFNDPAALRRLEEIVHPAVGVEVGRRVATAETSVVVLEAIKLIESGLHRTCQALWVTHCPREEQIKRLIEGRAFSPAQARQRIDAQPPQTEKISLADVVIDTSGDVAETRRQVEAAWRAIPKGESYGKVPSLPS